MFDLLFPFSDEVRSSLAVLKESALDEGYGSRSGRSGNVIDSVVRGGLGSGVGGLRALTGVLKPDFLDISNVTTPSAYGGRLKVEGGLSSCRVEGGVGGKPDSAPLRDMGDSPRSVWFSLLACDSVSSSEHGRSSLSGTAAGTML